MRHSHVVNSFNRLALTGYGSKVTYCTLYDSRVGQVDLRLADQYSPGRGGGGGLTPLAVDIKGTPTFTVHPLAYISSIGTVLAHCLTDLTVSLYETWKEKLARCLLLKEKRVKRVQGE